MTRKRARTESGHFKADDPNTPENEAWEEAPKKTSTRKSAPKKAAAPTSHMFVSANPENAAFDIRIGDDIKIKGAWDVQRAFVMWRVPSELLDMVNKHHHVWSGRIVPYTEDE